MELPATDRSRIFTYQNLHCLVPTVKQSNNNKTADVERESRLGSLQEEDKWQHINNSPPPHWSIWRASVDLSNAIHCLSIGTSRIAAAVWYECLYVHSISSLSWELPGQVINQQTHTLLRQLLIRQVELLDSMPHFITHQDIQALRVCISNTRTSKSGVMWSYNSLVQEGL